MCGVCVGVFRSRSGKMKNDCFLFGHSYSYNHVPRLHLLENSLLQRYALAMAPNEHCILVVMYRYMPSGAYFMVYIKIWAT